MKLPEKLAPAGALTAALLSIGCCLPFAIPAALGLAGVSAFASAYQPWMIGASFALLVAGIVQIVRRPACGRRRSRASIVLLGVSAALVLAVVFAPQSVAGFLAEPGGGNDTALTDLDPPSYARLKSEFNAAAGRVRVIALLSPT